MSRAATLMRTAQAVVGALPEPVGRGIFGTVGAVAGLSSLKGVKQMRRNYARIDPRLTGLQARRASATGMTHYMRYYYEVLRQSKVTQEQLPNRVTLNNGEYLRSEFAAGRGVPAALIHGGNWDLAGAWAEKHLAHVVTVAEALADPAMLQGFLDFRTGLGMKVYLTVKGEPIIDRLVEEMESGSPLVPLLADRDLSATGVEAPLGSGTIMLAPGPALLAQRTGRPFVPLFIRHEELRGDVRRRAGTKWGIGIDLGDPIAATVGADASLEERRADISRMMGEFASQLEDWLDDHLLHWHMLQKVFKEDLDPARLARAREAAGPEAIVEAP